MISTKAIMRASSFTNLNSFSPLLLKTTLLFIALSWVSLSFAQSVDPRIQSTKLSLSEVELVLLPSVDNAALLAAELDRRGPGIAPRFAETFEVDITPETHGNWEVHSNGTSTWRLRIRSEEAYSLNLGFTTFVMPEAGTLILYDSKYDQIMGPFTPADNEEHEQLWTPIFDGEELVIEVNIPTSQRANLGLRLKSINHDFIGFSEMSILSGSCNLDVICGAADGWAIVDQYRDIIQSVAVIGLNGGTFCTGFLINNTREDCTPYFMTANHCGINNGNAPSLVAYWNYENSTCRQPNSSASGGNGDGPLNDFNSGSIFRASYAPSDFTLVELDDPVSETANAYFAGWSREELAPADTVIAVHHPNTDEKRISFEFDPTYVAAGTSSSPNPNGDHIVVPDWDIGTTEGGSSGSPLFNNEKQVVGQLHAGAAACGNDSYDTYGWFFTSWEGGGTPSTRLKDWLDTDNVGSMTLDGRWLEQCSFFVGADPESREICAPQSAIFTLEVSGNFNANVGISIEGVPNGANTDFSTNPVAPGGTTTLTISNTAAADPGSYALTITATDGTETVTTFLQLDISEGTPEQVNLQSPANGAGGTVTVPVLEWSSNGDDVNYEVEVSTNENFTALVDSDDNLTGTSYQTTLLNSSTTYYWRIKPSNTCGEGDWSETYSFTTGNISCAPLTAADTPLEISSEGAPTVISTIEVTADGNVSEISVLDLDITHTYIGDLQAELTSPSGTTISLFNRPGFPSSTFGCNGDNMLVSFSDNAASSSEAFENTCNDSPAIEGTYQPVDALLAFAGEPITGTWTLVLSDNIDQDAGQLNGWSLDICSIVPDATTITAEETEFSICPEEELSFNLSIGNGFSGGSVTLSPSDAPLGTEVEFSQNPAMPGSTVTVTLSNLPNSGTSTIVFSGTDGQSESSASIMVTILDAPATATLQAPASGAIDVPLTVELSWQNALFAESYIVEVATDAGFNTLIFTESVTTESFTANGLGSETTYFWRVTSINDCGASTSSTFSFTTGIENCAPLSAEDIPLPITTTGTPTITSFIEVPFDGIIQDLRVFDLDISHSFVGDLFITLTSPSGTTVVLLDRMGFPTLNFGCNGDDLLLNFDDLANNTADDLENTCGDLPAAEGDYQPVEALAAFQGESAAGVWTLTITDNVDQDGGTLNFWALDICSSAPNDLSLNPSNADFEICASDQVTFQLTVGTAFSQNGVTLSATGNPAGSVVNFSQNPADPGSVVNVTVSNINQEGDYTINLIGDDGQNEIDTEIEIVVAGAPSTPILLNPVDGEVDLPLSNLLTWTENSQATSYQVIFAANPSFTNPIFDEIVDNNSLTVSGLNYNTTYYWTVIAINDCGESEDNEIFSFTTVQDLSFTVNPGVRDACQVQSPGFSLIISEGFNNPVTISYTVSPNQPIDIEFSVDPNNVPPGSPVVALLTNLITIPEGNYTITFQLDDGTNSTDAVAMLNLGSAPTIPTMISPMNGVTIMDAAPTLDWEPVGNATEYIVEVALDDAFSNIVESETVVGNSYTVQSMLMSNIYFWRVTASNDCGEATPQAFSFTVQTNSINELNGSTISIQPNPTSGQLSILLSEPLREELLVNVYAVNGQLLQTRRFTSGITNMELNLSNQAAGVYLIRLVNQEASLVKRIIVQK